MAFFYYVMPWAQNIELVCSCVSGLAARPKYFICNGQSVPLFGCEQLSYACELSYVMATQLCYAAVSMCL
jgi:hypothetical protein